MASGWLSSLPQYLSALAFGYLLGSIPFGLVFTRFAGTADIRSIGSGNIGATNVLRTGRKGLAAATLLADMLKGTAAVLLVFAISRREYALMAGLGAFLGHLFPVWLRFKGGKGVATYIGVLLAVAWQAMLLFAVLWLAVAFVTRYSSLSALLASAAIPPVLWYFGLAHEAALFGAMTVLLWIMHRANIARLLEGAEGKISFGRAPNAEG
jgi:acyl phosphate:glycerol-3-phosphate acyltransferase